jgi:hypothetical protein
MQPVDPSAKDDMKRLIELMNKGVDFEETSAPFTNDMSTPDTIPVVESYSALSLDPAVADMKRLLEALNGAQAQDPVRRQTDRSTRDRELREALVTETTHRGTRIGSWEIIVNESAQGLKTFDISNIKTGEAIASELTLYDAAHGIARLLNEGVTINSREIREILNTEANYARSRASAALYKTRMKETTSESRRAIMEDRYMDALEKAKLARITLTKIVG